MLSQTELFFLTFAGVAAEVPDTRRTTRVAVSFFNQDDRMNISSQDTLTVDCTRPGRLYRYASSHWLERSLKLGEFRMRPAAEYGDLLNDPARHDDELVRLQSTPGECVKIEIVGQGRIINPIGPVTYRSEIHTNYVVCCFSRIWDESLFHVFSDADACLVINEVEEFCERMHAAADTQLPGWVGIDGAVTYGSRSALGAVFSKANRFAQQQEWRFAWTPPTPTRALTAKFLNVGSIENLAEIRLRSANPVN